MVASPAKMLTIRSLQNDGVKLDFIEKWVLKVKNRKRENPCALVGAYRDFLKVHFQNGYHCYGLSPIVYGRGVLC